jgi:hypothetical protein
VGERRARGGGSGGGGSGGGARGLGGGGPSIVGISGSMRARDVSRPTGEHDADAERRVVIRRVPQDKAGQPAPQRRQQRPSKPPPAAD